MASEKHVNYFTNQARGAVVHFRVATNSVPAELIITYNAVIGFGNEPDVEWRITKWPVNKKCPRRMLPHLSARCWQPELTPPSADCDGKTAREIASAAGLTKAVPLL